MQTYETVKNGGKAVKYRVNNIQSGESQTVEANTKQQAVELTGWFIGWCNVYEVKDMSTRGAA